MWTVKGLIEHANSTSAEIDGEWVPARPLNHRHRTFMGRLWEAWLVFAGKADALVWPKDQ
jgi:hypothetical protein